MGEPSEEQLAFARLLWAELGHTILAPDGGLDPDDHALDDECRALFGFGLLACDRAEVSDLIDTLADQCRQARKQEWLPI